MRLEELNKKIVSIFESTGLSSEDSRTVADMLTLAEASGISSHGVIRIPFYLEGIYEENVNTQPNISVDRETSSTTVINADNTLGVISSKFAMQKAIEKADEHGTAFSSVYNSNHYGIGAYYSEMACERDMIGIALTNSKPYVAATGSTEKLLGTNPIAVAFPTNSDKHFSADFTTSASAMGKLTILNLQDKKVPNLIVQDENGHDTDDPDILSKGGAILPLGGDIDHGGHKGYALGAVTDILSGVLSGANFSKYVGDEKNQYGKGYGHFFGAMRIDAFMDIAEFKDRMDIWIDRIKSSRKTPNVEEIFVPGEIEWKNRQLAKQNGINLDPKITSKVNESLIKYNIDIQFDENS